MDLKTIVTLSVTILVAAAGYLFKYLNDLKLSQRKDRLERVDRQLRELYGPLFALDRASTMAWTAFRSRYRPGEAFWGTASSPTEEEAAAWRLWMTEVFMPLNLEMTQIITERADLLEESEMPDVLLELCAHVYAYKPVIREWEQGDYSLHTSIINFPMALRDYTSESYVRLKREQARLLGK